MNNEEKIISILSTLSDTVNNLQIDMQDLKTDMQEVNGEYLFSMFNAIRNIDDKFTKQVKSS